MVKLLNCQMLNYLNSNKTIQKRKAPIIFASFALSINQLNFYAYHSHF